MIFRPGVRTTTVFTACLAAWGSAASAQEVPEQLDFPPRVGYVMDLADVVDREARNLMEDMASEVRRKSQGDIVVVTLNSLEGVPPDSLASMLSRQWSVGYRGPPDHPATDTGVLIVLAVDDREFSIQVQDGMREFFPEAAIRDLVTSKVVEPFRAGDYSTGLVETVRGVAESFAQRFQFELESG